MIEGRDRSATPGAGPPGPTPIRPLGGFRSIRAKLGSVVVFAVAATILIMYVAVGFALRSSERDRRFRELLAQARGVAALAFEPSGVASPSLPAVLGQVPNAVLVVDVTGRQLIGNMRLPRTAARALSGSVDTGTSGNREYLGVPVVRQQRVVGAVYLSQRIEGSGVWGAVSGTAAFVRSFWWQLLLAGAVSAVIALGLARLLARGMTQPLRDMAHAARRMERGDYAQRVEALSRDEVGQLAEAFNRMAKELDGVERLRRDLVANVSHELKTPISALRAHLENLLDGVEEPNKRVLGVMLQQSERLSHLVEELLDLSRLESGDVPLRVEPVRLAPLVESVEREVEVAHAGRGVEIRNEVPDDVPPVPGDRDRIHQVLFNLIDNAVRYSPPGSAVVVTGERRNGWCEVAVRDAGPGIPTEDLDRVFERFYRADPSRSREDGGTGIGLTIARSVVEAHGGRIWAESDGHGSTFRFVLPVSEEEPPRVTAPAASVGEGT